MAERVMPLLSRRDGHPPCQLSGLGPGADLSCGHKVSTVAPPPVPVLPVQPSALHLAPVLPAQPPCSPPSPPCLVWAWPEPIQGKDLGRMLQWGTEGIVPAGSGSLLKAGGCHPMGPHSAGSL